MTDMIFVNLPVSDLAASVAFYEAIGHTVNPDFSDESTTSLVVSDAIVVMLHTHEKFLTFTPERSVADTTSSLQALFARSASSRDEVDATLDSVLAAGGTEFRPAEDHGFMYGRSYADLDGHVWELVWMDPSQLPDQ